MSEVNKLLRWQQMAFVTTTFVTIMINKQDFMKKQNHRGEDFYSSSHLACTAIPRPTPSSILTLSILKGFPNMCCLTGTVSISLSGAGNRFK